MAQSKSFSLLKIGKLWWLALFLSAASNAQELQLNQPVTKEIKKDETQVFNISAKKDDFFRFVVWQKGADVSLKLTSDKNEELIKVDNSNSPEEPERISFIANEAGQFRIEIGASRTWKAPNNYELTLESLRPAIEKDKSQIEAEKLYNQAILDAWFSKDRNGKVLAVKSFNDSIPFFQIAQDRLGEAFVYYYLGILLYGRNQFRESIENSAKSAKIFRELKALPQLAVVLSNQAAVHYKFQEFRESEILSLESLEIYRQLNDRKNFAKVGGNLALIAASNGKRTQAIKRFEEILPVFQAENDLVQQAVVFHNLGSIYDDLGDSENAILYLQKALKIRQERDSDKPQLAVTLVNLGAVLKRNNKPQEALKHIEQALEIFKELDNEINQAVCFNNLGGIYDDLGNYPLALQNYQKSLELNRKLGHRAYEADTLKNLAQLSLKYGEISKALDFQTKNLEIIEDRRTKIFQQDQQIKFFASKQDDYELYIDLLMRQHRTQPDKGLEALALQASERMRARNLLESIGATELREGIPAELLQKEKEQRRKINLLEDTRQRMVAAKLPKEQISQAEEIIETNLKSLYEIWANMRSSSPKYGDFTQPKPLSLAEIQQTILDEDSVLLEYALGTEKSYLFLVTKDALKTIELPKRAEIETVARSFYDNLKVRTIRKENETDANRQTRLNKADAERQKNAMALSKILLSPVAKEVENKRLLIVASEVLQYIPFSALSSPKTNNQFLIETNQIVNLPSASALATLRKIERKPFSKDIAIFADPIFNGDDARIRPASGFRSSFQRLDFSREEAEKIASLAPSEKRLLALDFRANLQNLRQQDLRQFKYLHFATHGTFDSQFPELSGIVLSLVDEKGNSQEGLLYLSEIYNLRLNAKLVVLSACETALGKEIKGEGLVGLTHAFMYAGTESVLASLWRIDDYATSELMQRFYQAMLKEGLPPDKALQKAQISMIKEKGLNNPFYWSAFTLQGDWR